MPSSSTAVMTTANAVLRLLIVLNIVAGILFAAILALSFPLQSDVLAAIAKGTPGVDAAAMFHVGRLVLAIGLVAVPLAHVLLRRLLEMVGTVRGGDPFVAANARRLRQIAWALLGLQLCDLGFGYADAMVPAGAEDLTGWSMSLTGWIAVLLLFVLARVFEHGTRMREELEGTV